MKPPWKIFHDEIRREIGRRDIDSMDDFLGVLGDVGDEAVVPHLTRELGWDADRAQRLFMEFIDVLAEHDRDEWGPKLKATWDEWR